MDNRKRVMGRTWLQLRYCTHSYNMQVCPIILEWSLETGVRQESDNGGTKVQRQRASQSGEICNRIINAEDTQ